MINSLKNFIFGGDAHNDSPIPSTPEAQSPPTSPPEIIQRSDGESSEIEDDIPNLILNTDPIPMEVESLAIRNLDNQFEIEERFANIRPPYLNDKIIRDNFIDINKRLYLKSEPFKYSDQLDSELYYRHEMAQQEGENIYPEPDSRFPIKREGMPDINNEDELRQIDEYTYETLKDPVTLQLMEFPMIASNGNTFSAHTLYNLFLKRTNPEDQVIDPITREKIDVIGINLEEDVGVQAQDYDRGLVRCIGIKNKHAQQAINKYINGKLKYQQGGKSIKSNIIKIL